MLNPFHGLGMIHEKSSFIPDEALGGNDMTAPGIAAIWFGPNQLIVIGQAY